MYKKFVLTVIAVIVILGPTGQFLLFKFTPLYNLNLMTKLYDDASWVKGEPKVLIMGSSHARYHIIPKEIARLNPHYTMKDIVNIGENAASPFEMYTAYKKQTQKFKHVELVYYTLEPHIFNEKYYLYNKYEKIFLNFAQWKYLEEKEKKKNEYFFPFQTFVNSLTFHIADRSRSNGFTYKKHKKFRPTTKQTILKQFTPLSLFPLSMFDVTYLGKLKKEVEARGGKFILVLTPAYAWQKYYAQYASDYDTQLVSALNNTLGPTPVIGSFWAEDFNLTYKNFYDDTHLSLSGASKFTKALFGNIDTHRHLKAAPLHHTYNYRFSPDSNNSNRQIFSPVILLNGL